MIAPEQARRNMEQAVEEVQQVVLSLLQERGEVPLREVLVEMEDRRPLELVSRALARLLTTEQVTLSTQRRLRVTASHTA